MTPTEQDIARELETRLRPHVAALTAASHGGMDTNGKPLPGLRERLEVVPDNLTRIAEWAEANLVPSKPSRRPGGRR